MTEKLCLVTTYDTHKASESHVTYETNLSNVNICINLLHAWMVSLRRPESIIIVSFLA